MYCRDCGAELRETDRFCSKCGASVKTTSGSSITTGNVTGVGISIGNGARSQVTQGLRGEEVVKLFNSIYQSIDTRRDDPDVDKRELTQTVRCVQQEVIKGEKANASKVKKWLGTLAKLAPDILDVTAAVLINPVTGAGSAVRKIAEIIRDQRNKE